MKAGQPVGALLTEASALQNDLQNAVTMLGEGRDPVEPAALQPDDHCS